MPARKYYTKEERKLAYAAHQRRWRAMNPERAKEIDNKSYKQAKSRNMVSQMLAAAKHRAKKRNLEFDLEAFDIIIPDYCPVFPYIKLERLNHATRPELDRKDNSKGYIKGNVFVISGKANGLKRDATVEDLEAILSYMKS